MQKALLNADEIKDERKARRFWVGLVVGFLGLQLMTNVIAVIAATSQKEDVVVPNYYQKGLDWDKRFDSIAPNAPVPNTDGGK